MFSHASLPRGALDGKPAPHVGIANASSRDVEGDFTDSSALFDNGEGPSSQERESVAARLRQRRLQMRAEASSGGVMDGIGGGYAGGVRGVRRRRRRRGEVEVLDAEYEDEDGNFYGLDGELVVDDDTEYAFDEGYGYDDEMRGVEAEYDDPYLGWSNGPAGNKSWSEEEDRVKGTRNASKAKDRDVVQPNDSNDSNDSSSEYQDTTNLLEPPDIVILNPEELDRVLPVLPFSEQADFFAGGAAQAVQRWGASLALTVLFSKAALLAATSLTWPLWWPWARAANKNFGIRSKVEYGGIWRTRILGVESGNRPRPKFGEEEELRTMPRFSAMKTCTIVVGEENGAQTKLVLPFDARYEYLRPGQPAEVLVLSSSTSFSDIKAIKDVYLPDKRLWLAEYPYIDRAEFVEVSLDIEREREGGSEVDNGPQTFNDGNY